MIHTDSYSCIAQDGPGVIHSRCVKIQNENLQQVSQRPQPLLCDIQRRVATSPTGREHCKVPLLLETYAGDLRVGSGHHLAFAGGVPSISLRGTWAPLREQPGPRVGRLRLLVRCAGMDRTAFVFALVSAPLPCICTPTTCTCTPALLEAAVSIPTVFEVVVIAVRLLLLPGGVRLALGIFSASMKWEGISLGDRRPRLRPSLRGK